MTQDSDEFDFFVSYARADNATGWISRFLQELVLAHQRLLGSRQLRYFLDAEDIRGFDDWRQRIFVEGLARSRLLLAFVSPRYLASEWCRREWVAWLDTEIAKHILSAGAAPIYIVEVPGFQNEALSDREIAHAVAELCGLAVLPGEFATAVAPVVGQIRRRQLVPVQSFYDGGLEALAGLTLQKVLTGLARDLERRANRVSRAGRSESTVPPYNPRFSGRTDELISLRERLCDDRRGVICSVHGLGGIGKTEFAFAYAHAFGGEYPGGRFVVKCAGHADLRTPLLQLDSVFYDQIPPAERRDLDRHASALSNCLRRRIATMGHVLLVLDNVTSRELLSAQGLDFLTVLGPKLHLLLTTRLGPTAAQGPTVILSELSTAAALDMLEKHRPFSSDGEHAAAQKIVSKLGGFPLALELVGAWLAVHSESMDYLTVAEALDLEALEEIAGDEDIELRRHNDERRLSAVVGPVLDDLSPLEQRALQYASWMEPDCVPLDWMAALLETETPQPAHSGLAAPAWAKASGRLERLSLFSRAEKQRRGKRIVRVHRLIQSMVQRRYPVETANAAEALFRFLMGRASVLWREWPEESRRWEIAPLATTASHWLERRPVEGAGLAGLVSEPLKGIGHLATAQDLLQRALTVRIETAVADRAGLVYSVVDGDIADRYSNLALIEGSLGNRREAVELLEKAEAIDRLGGSPPIDTALRLSNRALLETNLQSTRDMLADAANAIDDRENRGDEATRILVYRNLAVAEKDLGNHGRARQLLERVSTLEDAFMTSDDPRRAVTLSVAGLLEQEAGNVEKAKGFLQSALDLWERTLGLEHHGTANAMVNLGRLAWETGEWEDGLRLVRGALGIWAKSENPNDPRRGKAYWVLGLEARRAGDAATARKHLEQALKLTSLAHPSQHPWVRSLRDELDRLGPDAVSEPE